MRLVVPRRGLVAVLVVPVCVSVSTVTAVHEAEEFSQFVAFLVEILLEAVILVAEDGELVWNVMKRSY